MNGIPDRLTRPIALHVLVVLAYVFAPPVARGDEFRLANGGAVRGELAGNRHGQGDDYTIRSDAGVTITLEAAAVADVVPQLPANEEYEKRKASAADTVEAQWALAEWCREQSLSQHRRVHLERVIQLDPDHAAARRALGYFFRDGKWVTQKQANTQRGLVQYNGRWITPQKARILEEEEQHRKQEGAWHSRIRQYIGALNRPQADQAAEFLRTIDDPVAISAIKKQMLSDPRPSRAPLRLLALESLARIGTPAAQQLIADAALYDSEEELRLSAAEYFEAHNSPDVVGYFVSKLRAEDPQVINRAASVLGALGDGAAVDPLIDVLVTTQRRKVTLGNPGSIGASFGSGGSGLSTGSQTVVVAETSFNDDVYAALRKLTGVDFGNRDVAAWKAWYATQRRASVIDTRRGE
ncbi:MAG: hypothetical protein R3C10_03775 [Pirellulales bacterium]